MSLLELFGDVDDFWKSFSLQKCSLSDKLEVT